ncbi:hypothetical protein Bealeia1_01223 [Candidatus Bealeia paramacronuclearis]|uniref:Uncharacterized protein n=1 Tax=Candidatus Bealeia paramacronuclearis TaxID=1921001 RepID=A0ABZ2C490_9PROT|nr:hypothetical protein [Candidatus Bealeia paramacronuclearis]
MKNNLSVLEICENFALSMNRKIALLCHPGKMEDPSVEKFFLLILLSAFLFTSPLGARCNKSGLEKLMDTRKTLCEKKKYEDECEVIDHDIKSYLASFANRNDRECDRLHKVYNAPDVAILEQHRLNVKKK